MEIQECLPKAEEALRQDEENHIRWFGHEQQGPLTISNQYKQVLQFKLKGPK